MAESIKRCFISVVSSYFFRLFVIYNKPSKDEIQHPSSHTEAESIDSHALYSELFDLVSRSLRKKNVKPTEVSFSRSGKWGSFRNQPCDGVTGRF